MWTTVGPTKDSRPFLIPKKIKTTPLGQFTQTNQGQREFAVFTLYTSD